MDLALNPALDIDALARNYAKRHRLRVDDALTPPAAQAAHDALRAVRWHVAFNTPGGVVELDPERIAAMGREELARALAGIQEGARHGYQFYYAYLPLLRLYFTPGVARHPLFAFFEFVNSQPVLDFVRRLTGLPSIRWADGQATMFTAGHFLKLHTDHAPSERRAAAYVFNFTPDWGEDWGGFLQFFDRNRDIEQALRPSFNALNIFTIPQDHSVSMVSSYVRAQRLSITGWFREDEPPGPIGGRVD